MVVAVVDQIMVLLLLVLLVVRVAAAQVVSPVKGTQVAA
jgi:hypothetical protein